MSQALKICLSMGNLSWPRWSRHTCQLCGLILTAYTGAFELHGREAQPGNLSVTTGAVRLDYDKADGQLTALSNLLTQAEFLKSPGSLYRLEGDPRIKADLQVRPLINGELELTLELSNPTTESLAVKPTFPLLEGLGSEGEDGLSYCFPQQGAVSDSEPAQLTREYSAGFPMQFMDVYHETNGGIYLATHDTSNQPRKYFLKKIERITMGVDYQQKLLRPHEAWVLTGVVGAHRGDWHDAFLAYRRWLGTCYQPESPRQRWFQDVFNFRQIFLHPNLGAPGAFDPQTKEYSIGEQLAADTAAFGGVDYLHIFDWALDPKHGRVGDYNTWEYLGGAERFHDQIANIQAHGVHVGLYFEGYLVDHRSEILKTAGTDWQLLSARGIPYARYGKGYVYPCPYVDAWRAYLASTCSSAIQKSGADGVYIDEYGFGWQYPCNNPAHHHPVPAGQMKGEEEMLRALRETLPKGRVLYTEETGTDVTSQYQDGSFTYSVSAARNHRNPSRANLFRFAVPGYKLFEIIRVDKPLGDDPEAVKNVFFNGEGIWLEGPLNDQWFPDSVRQVIAKTHRILRQYSEAFRSENSIPLVPTLEKEIFANEFPGEQKVVWTLYNGGNSAADGELLKVHHRPGFQYLDVWNGKPLSPRIVGEDAFLKLHLESHDAGCIVQQATSLASRP
jgi:hypothetical protein